MPSPTKTFRVFVSSTFTDMKEERRILQKNVFPKLEKHCAENGAKFQAVDLRWGVTEESSLNQKTLDICINEIDRCQRISPKPNFVILLGDKYGWQPIPTKIPKREMDETLQSVSEEKRKLLEAWYRLDTNAIPAEFVLQPREGEYENYSDWEIIEKELQRILRHAVEKLSFTDNQKVKYLSSATHQEILAGALDLDESKEDPAEHVLALVRKTDGLPNGKKADGFLDLVDGKPDPYSQTQLADLKEELKEKLGDHFILYSADWTDNKLHLQDPDSFEDQVFEFLKDIISKQIEQIISPDEIEHEKNLHDEFKYKLTEHFSGRDTVLKKIDQYIVDPSDRRPKALIGASGSGKSSVMAKVIQETEDRFPNAVIVCRFIGATSTSSNIISLLQSVGGQVAEAFNTSLESIAGEGSEKALHELSSLSEVFKKCLALGTVEKPVYIFLDALDQLSDNENAGSLYWIPSELTENTRLVISALPELESALSNTSPIELPVLNQLEAEQILDKWFKAIGRRLTPEQQQLLIEKFQKTGLAIFLKLAFEMARDWYSYTTNIKLEKDVEGVINDYINSLHDDHNEDFIKDAICLMLCGRYQGLAENEILEIFAFDDELWNKFLETTHEDHRQELIDMREELKGSMKIPIVVWSRLYLDLEPFLTERDAHGVPLITFFHRQFIEVLGERYGLIKQDELVN